jgi:hypothetical protein
MRKSVVYVEDKACSQYPVSAVCAQPTQMLDNDGKHVSQILKGTRVKVTAYEFFVDDGNILLVHDIAKGLL